MAMESSRQEAANGSLSAEIAFGQDRFDFHQAVQGKRKKAKKSGTTTFPFP